MLTGEYTAHLDKQGVSAEQVVAACQLEDGSTQLAVIRDEMEETIAEMIVDLL